MADDRANDERDGDGGSRGHDDDASVDDGRTTSLPPKLERWRRRSAAGAIMTAAALGLQQVFEPERKEPAIMLETSGTPPEDLPVDVDIDGFTAKQSVVRIRPWLLERTGGTEGPADGTGADRNADAHDRADRDPDRPGPAH